MQFKLIPYHHVPPVASYWFHFRKPKEDGWQHAFIVHIKHFEVLVRGENVCINETVELD